MALNNGIIFYGLQRDSDDFIHMLDQRITERINAVQERAESPISYEQKYDAFFIDKKYLGHSQEGGYTTKEQATIALALLKVRPDLNYQEVYAMSNFIVKGLDIAQL